ncbi:hypothetical protein F5Y04DRAFT_254301, partial [Hypomontagnella monticulosa]
MDPANTTNPPQQLSSAKIIGIADLGPELLEPASCAIRSVVTITWPYNSVKGTFAFILAEPDYRLRRNKGQVRINLSGSSAKAAGESGLSSGDEVLLSLDSVEWEPEQVKKRQSLPGAGIDWQANFGEKVLLQVTLTETGETKSIVVDHPPAVEPQHHIETPPAELDHAELPPTQTLKALTPPRNKHIRKLEDGEYESPAFVKRARLSYGSLFEDGYDIFKDDGGVEGKGRKRTSFGRHSGAWKYVSRSPSPEPGPDSPGNHANSSPRLEVADEGCQTMEIDFPTPLAAQHSVTFEAQTSPQPTPHEEQVIQQQGMTDQGIHADFHGHWPTTIPTPLPPFSPNTEPPNAELPTIQTADQFNTVDNNFQQGWVPGAMDFTPDEYSHPTEPSDAFASAYGGDGSLGLGAQTSKSRTRSLSEPNNLAIEHVDDDLNNDLPTDEHAPIPPQSTAYPPLDPDEQPDLGSQTARFDYPASYLDDRHPFSRDTTDVEHGRFGPRIPTAAHAGPSWATINNPSQATSVPHTNRRDSAEGNSADTPLVIGESDSDDDPPPPTAAEDTVRDGRADALEMYEDAEVEDEVDAEYSDDDEPEYDADEIGGDYDTRNYTAPDDDEDDSHDDDLRPHRLEPEFDDGGSWDGEEEDGENLEDESDYEMDDNDEEPQRSLPSQSGPQIIDLISSSEDEEDDENTQPQPLSRAIPDSISRTQPRIVPSESSGRMLRWEPASESEEDESEEEDEEQEQENDSEDGESAQVSDDSESEFSSREDKDVQGPLEDEHEEAADISKDDDVTEPIGVRNRHISIVPEDIHTNEFSVNQKGLPQTDSAVSISPRGDGKMEDVQVDEGKEDIHASQSAVEGLEILSRAVESESNANKQAAQFGTMPVDIVDATSPDVSDLEGQEEDTHEQTEHESHDEDMVDMVSTLSDAARDSQPAVIDEEKRVEAVAFAPSSPPLTHSFRSQPVEKPDTGLQEASITAEPRSIREQLPTPRDTQLTGEVIAADILTEADESEDVSIVGHVETVVNEVSSAPEPLVDTDQHVGITADTVMQAEELPTEASVVQRLQTPSEDIRQDTQLDEPVVSPSLSFQTQVGADDTTQASFIEHTAGVVVETDVEVDSQSTTKVEVSVATTSFISQMEVDDELQASILEYSQDLNEVEAELVEEHEMGDRSEDHEDEAILAENEDEVHTELDTEEVISRDPSPDLGTEMHKRRDTGRPVPKIAPERTSQVDPSVQLARAANASKRNAKQHDTVKNTRTDRKSATMLESSPPPVEDPGVQLARASLSNKPQEEEESSSMTAAKLKVVRYLRDELPDCTPLKILRQHLKEKLDVIAVAMMQPPDPQRAKGGPREYMMSFTITDHSIGPFSVAEVQLYRPHKETLPIVKAGDVVLLRNFTAISLQNKGFGLRTNDESSWAVFDHEDQPAQIKGPPVEYGEKETNFVAHLRAWFHLLDEKAMVKLERANKKIVSAGKS